MMADDAESLVTEPSPTDACAVDTICKPPEDSLPDSTTLCNNTIASNGDACSADCNVGDDDASKVCRVREMVELKVIYNKQKYDVTIALDDTVDDLKQTIEKLTDVPVAMQKLMYKGRMGDGATLRECKVVNAAKIMLVGSTVNDVLAVNEPAAKSTKTPDMSSSTSASEPLCKQKVHKTVLDKHGKPDDVMPGIKAHREALPPHPIAGMYNKSGGKVRLTFKLEAGQVWLGTKERTEKLSLGSIKSVISEPIEGHDEYHIMALQLGPTEASRYWIYWVPAQYVDAIKDAILGTWQYF